MSFIYDEDYNHHIRTIENGNTGEKTWTFERTPREEGPRLDEVRCLRGPEPSELPTPRGPQEEEAESFESD
jgi:hypothetical protein